jgi:hypothetical protein
MGVAPLLVFAVPQFRTARHQRSGARYFAPGEPHEDTVPPGALSLAELLTALLAVGSRDAGHSLFGNRAESAARPRPQHGDAVRDPGSPRPPGSAASHGRPGTKRRRTANSASIRQTRTVMAVAPLAPLSITNRRAAPVDGVALRRAPTPSMSDQRQVSGRGGMRADHAVLGATPTATVWPSPTRAGPCAAGRVRVPWKYATTRQPPRADLGDGGHVDRVVQAPVAAPGQPEATRGIRLRFTCLHACQFQAVARDRDSRGPRTQDRHRPRVPRRQNGVDQVAEARAGRSLRARSL